MALCDHVPYHTSQLPPFITTLGTLGIAQGLSLLVTDGQSVVGIPRSIEILYTGTVISLPIARGLA